MPDKFDNPNFAISQDNLAMVERKERESRLSSGMTSSWTSPPDPELVPPDKMKMILESRAKQVDKDREFVKAHITEREGPASRACLVTIPKQALKPFLRVLPLFEAVQVNLTTDQRKMLLEALQGLKTPPNLMDAKAIFNLMEVLAQ